MVIFPPFPAKPHQQVVRWMVDFSSEGRREEEAGWLRIPTDRQEDSMMVIFKCVFCEDEDEDEETRKDLLVS